MAEVAGAKQLRRLLDAVVTVGSELRLDQVLERIIEVAVDLVGARYGALGVLDPERTRLVEFITVGLDADRRRQIGRLPEGHGILGLLIVDPHPLRLPNLREHPDSYGFPPNHPPMTSFLGVPIRIRGEVFGNLYLTDKADDEVFTDVDEELVVGLAAAAGVAIENARLHMRAREVSLLEDRERIARDLHDTVIQRLFATGLSLQGAVRLADRPEVGERIQQAVDDLDITVRQIRSAIFELHSTQLAGHSLRRELLAVGHEQAEALGFDPVFRFEGAIDSAVPEGVAEHVLAAVREGLANVARHAKATRAEVVVAVADGMLGVTVTDDGVGPPPEPRDRTSHGLDNLQGRAVGLGGWSRLEPGDRAGTALHWQVPLTP